jgi:hypothetical protein
LNKAKSLDCELPERDSVKLAKKLDVAGMLSVIFLENPTSYGTAKSPGRPKAVTPRDERRIGRAFSNSQMSLRRAKNDLGLADSKSSIHRALKRNSNIKCIKMQPALKLTKRHKDLRMQYARKYMSWKNEWKQVWILMVVICILGHFFR